MNTQFLILALVAFIPILIWMYFFQTQHREKKVYVALTFLAGMLSVIPIKIYERYWDTAVLSLENINLFEKIEDLTHIPNIDTFFAYILTFTIVSLGLFLFVAVAMFILEVLSGDNTISVFKKKTAKIFESPFLFATTGVIFGVAAFFLNMKLSEAMWFFIIVGALEEFVKHLVTRFSDEFKLKSVADAIQFSIIVALGFAFVENILYFLDIWGGDRYSTGELMVYILLRSTISVTAHISFSAILGYYYGIAHFASEIYQEECRYKRHPLIQFLHSVLHVKSVTLFREEKMLEGMLLAMVIHAIFNTFLEFNKMGIVITMLCVMFFVTVNLIHRTEVHRRVGTTVS